MLRCPGIQTPRNRSNNEQVFLEFLGFRHPAMLLRCSILRLAALRLQEFGRMTSPVGALVSAGIRHILLFSCWTPRRQVSRLHSLPLLLNWMVDNFYRLSCLSVSLQGRHKKHGFAWYIHTLAHGQQVPLIAGPWEEFHPDFALQHQVVSAWSAAATACYTMLVVSKTVKDALVYSIKQKLQVSGSAADVSLSPQP